MRTAGESDISHDDKGTLYTCDVPLIIHLIDGTYELFRHYYAVPKAQDKNGIEVAAVRGVLGSIRGMLEQPRRDAHRRRDGSRDRIVSQRHVAGIQDRRRHRARSAVAVPPARRNPVRIRRRRVADGRARGRRCARGGGGEGGGRSARDAGAHLHAGQGSRAGGQRHAHRAGGSFAPHAFATRPA